MVETPTSFYGSLLHLDCFLRTRPDSRAVTQHQVFKYLPIKKTWIRLSGLCSVTRLVRIALYGDFLPHREAHLEISGNLPEVAPQLMGGGWSVERRVVPDGAEYRLPFVAILAVHTKAFPRKRSLGVLLVIDLGLPAFMRLGRSAKANKH